MTRTLWLVGVGIAIGLLVWTAGGPPAPHPAGTRLPAGSVEPAGARGAAGRIHPVADTATDSNVSFDGRGLPTGTDWEVVTARNGSLFASDDSTLSADVNETLPDGVYNISAAANQPNYETYGAPATVALTGLNTTVVERFWLGYHLTVAPSGLPYNVSWNLSLSADGLTQNVTLAGDASADFWIPAGPYTFLDASSGFASSTGSGTGDLAHNTSVSLAFVREKIPPGFLTVSLDVAAADFYLNGVVYLGIPSGRTSFNLTPGVWTAIVLASGYVPYYNVTRIVSNETVMMDVRLAANPPSPAPPILSGTAEAIVILLGVGLAVIVALFVLAARRLANR